MTASVAFRGYKFALAELLLAGGILVVGVPTTQSAFETLRLQTRLNGATSPENLDIGRDTGLAEIEQAVPPTAGAQRDLAYALLALADSPARSAADRQILLDRSVVEFRRYVGRVPGDGRAWAGLASAELARGNAKSAEAALKASILTSPWSPSLVAWRCQLGVDLVRELDDEGRDLVRSQLRLQADRSIAVLVDIVTRREAVHAARILLASSPDELIAFEIELAKRK